MDELFYGGPSQTISRHSDNHGSYTDVPEPPPDLDGLLFSQAFNNSSQAQFSLTQLNSSQQIGSRKKRPPDTGSNHPTQKVAKAHRSSQIGVISPSSVARPQRVTRPIFKPPLKLSSNGYGAKKQASVLPTSSVDQDSGFLDGSQYESTSTYSPPRAVAAVTPSTRRVQSSVNRTPAVDKDIDTPHYPLYLAGETPGGSDRGVIKLRPVSEIPSQYRSIFSFPYFNIVQSKVLDDVMYSDKAVVLCAPTGSGKTVLFELAIIRNLIQQQTLPSSHYKVVYMAPMKALCSERYEDWTEKFGPLGMKCKELTGDTELDDYFELQDVHIILTTPEKWDSMTRKWRDNKSLVQMVRLFLVDEVHMLNDDTRGATMEAVVSRMKTVESALTRSARDNQTDYAGIRFMAVSATVPNVQDVAAWLDRETASSICHSFDDSCRPVRLRKVVLGYPCSENTSEFKFDLSLNYKLAGVIETYSDQKPSLVFCATRKSVQQAASTLVKEARFIMNSQHKQRLQVKANTLRESKLRDLVLCGVGYHHAGLDLHDRKAVEELFLKGDLPVLIATSTLAMGVNLPAHLVIIKSTQHYVMGLYQEYSETQILQMIGRAGRPQFDTSATAVIMTRTGTKRKYDDLLHGNQLVESSLHKNLVEHLNAEIVLETISDVSVALEWIRSTFLYIRVMKNPKHYGYSEGQNREQIENKLQELCLKNLNSLASINLVKMGPDGFTLKATETGRLMARYCIAYDTMKQFQEVSETESLSELLVVLCNSKEFRDVQLRNNEKKTLNTLNKDKNRITIRFPMEGKIKTNEMKVNCLVQAQLGSLSVQDFALAQDIGKIFRSTVRISRCLLEVHWHRPYFKTLLNAVLLAKCCKAKLWENSKHISRQLTGIGAMLSNALVNAGLVTFQKIEETNPREIELIVNRHPPFGNQVRDAVSHLPKYEVCIDQSTAYKESQAEITITIAMTNKELVSEKSSVSTAHTNMLLVGDADNNIVYKARISDAFLMKNEQWFRRIEVKRASRGEELSINLISQDFVGLDVQSTYTPFYTGPKRIRRVPAESAAQKSTYDEGPPQKLRGGGEREGSEREPPPLGPNRRPCSHMCNNKNACGHDCCKYGVTIRSTTPRATMMDSLRKELRQKKDKLPETPLKPLKSSTLKQFAKSQDLPRTKETPRGLEQFAYKPVQEKMPSSTSSGPHKQQPAAVVPPHPRGSGWENIDLCQQRSLGTREWNLQQPRDKLMEEVFEINSSDDDLMETSYRWYQEGRTDRHQNRYEDTFDKRNANEDDYLPDLVPEQSIIYDKWNRMQVASQDDENYAPSVTAPRSVYQGSFHDELDPPIEDFSPVRDTRSQQQNETFIKPLRLPLSNQSDVRVHNDNYRSYLSGDVYEIDDDDFEDNSLNITSKPSERHEEQPEMKLGMENNQTNYKEGNQDRVTFDIGYYDLGSSFSDESPTNQTVGEDMTGHSDEHQVREAQYTSTHPEAIKQDRPQPKVTLGNLASYPDTSAGLSTAKIMKSPATMFIPSGIRQDASPARSHDKRGSMFENIFEGIF